MEGLVDHCQDFNLDSEYGGEPLENLELNNNTIGHRLNI